MMHPVFARAIDAPIQATVLVAVCDCAGFARQTRDRSSAEVFADLHDLYQLIEDAVTAAGGLVLKFMGDAALIIFPEELAEAGILALLVLKAEVDVWLKDHAVGDALQVNVHLGEVTLGRLGRAGHLDAIGETVNVAARLGVRSFGLSEQAYQRLSPEHQRLFQPAAAPLTYEAVTPLPRGFP